MKLFHCNDLHIEIGHCLGRGHGDCAVLFALGTLPYSSSQCKAFRAMNGMLLGPQSKDKVVKEKKSSISIAGAIIDPVLW